MHFTQIKSQLKNTGSATAIMISAMASTAILTTILITQQSASIFVSKKSDVLEQWQAELINRHALTVGGYLISHNLILCKEGGWENEDTICKWTHADNGKQPVDFNLTPETINKPKEVENMLSYIGTLTIADDNNANNNENNSEKKYKYRISFDLTKWKGSDFEPLIGDIPLSTCRNADNLQINTDGLCGDIDGDGEPNNSIDIAKALSSEEPAERNKALYCRNKNNKKLMNGKGGNDKAECEYISMVDQDHHIVVIRVESHPEDHINPNKKITLSGIRRPLAKINVEVTIPPTCSGKCAANHTGNPYPGCRGRSELSGNPGDTTTLQYTDLNGATLEMMITNKGPGAIYSLSLLKTYTELDGHKKIEDVKSARQIPKVTPNLLEQAQKEVLLPNESIRVPDIVPCLSELDIVTSVTSTRLPPPRVNQQQQASVTTLQTSTQVRTPDPTNIHAQEFMTLKYGFGYLQSSINDGFASCVKNNLVIDDGNQPCLTADQLSGSITNNPCGNGGICRYPHIEPRKLFSPTDTETQGGAKQILSITVRYVVPH